MKKVFHDQNTLVNSARFIAPFIEECLQKSGFSYFVVNDHPSLEGDITVGNVSLTIEDDYEINQKYSSQTKQDLSQILGFTEWDELGNNKSYVKKGKLKKVFLTAMHELGHALGPYLGTTYHEEIKAYTFEIGTYKLIEKYNLGGLRGKLVDPRDEFPNSKEYPEHARALKFVNAISKEVHPLQLFREILYNRFTLPEF